MRRLLLASSILALAFASCQTESTSDCDNGYHCGFSDEDKCVDIESDPDHCGGCGNRCEADEWCSNGTCCREGEECGPVATSGSCSGANCNGECIEVWNEDHCGGCNMACAPGQECFAGECIGGDMSSESGIADSGSSGDSDSSSDSGSSGDSDSTSDASSSSGASTS